MKKKMMLAVCISSFISLNSVVWAENTQAHESSDKSHKSEAKSGRKKRQLMCKDCGKPEKNCECKGEGHGEGKEHGHDEHKEASH